MGRFISKNRVLQKKKHIYVWWKLLMLHSLYQKQPLQIPVCNSTTQKSGFKTKRPTNALLAMQKNSGGICLDADSGIFKASIIYPTLSTKEALAANLQCFIWPEAKFKKKKKRKLPLWPQHNTYTFLLLALFSHLFLQRNSFLCLFHQNHDIIPAMHNLTAWCLIYNIAFV